MLRRRTVPSREVNFVRSLISTGTQYIDTQLSVDERTVIEASLYIEQFHKTYENYFGCQANECAMIRKAGENEVGFPFMTANERMNYLDFSTPGKADVVINTQDRTYSLNGVKKTYSAIPSTAVFAGTSMWIFAKKKINSEAMDVPGIFKLYSFAMTKAGQKVIDLYPALDNQGIACLYDMVSGKYFYNSGTGEFEYEQT